MLTAIGVLSVLLLVLTFIMDECDVIERPLSTFFYLISLVGSVTFIHGTLTA